LAVTLLALRASGRESNYLGTVSMWTFQQRTHSGSFSLRGGLWTAALAICPVKKAFETHVRGHFDALVVEFAAKGTPPASP
jgi:hypothetical protein